jgi:hypothetical protein
VKETSTKNGEKGMTDNEIPKKGVWFRMNIPLSYQFSEFDCAPVTFLNAFLYLYDRTVTEPEMIKAIILHSFDLSDGNGEKGKGGTSVDAVKHITTWLNTYSDKKGLGFNCICLVEEEVDLIKNEDIKNCINNGGVGITTVCITEGIYHYVLVVKIDQEYVYFFDSYYTSDQQHDDHIDYIDDRPTKYNRRVKFDWFISNEERFYSLGKKERRKWILINK